MTTPTPDLSAIEEKARQAETQGQGVSRKTLKGLSVDDLSDTPEDAEETEADKDD